MADVGMKDFLLQYYMQLRFNAMPAEIRAQYDVYVKSDDFRGNMKDWKKKLMHDDGTGRYVQNDLPDPMDPNGNYHLTDDEWAKLFKAYQKALRGMAASLARGDEEINDDARGFINEYFGASATHLFSNAQVAPGYDTQLDAINNVLGANSQLEYVLRQGGYNEPSFSDLKSGLRSKKYNSDPKFQAQLIQIIGFLSWKCTEDPTVAGWFSGIDLSDIANNAFADTTIDPTKLDNFKRNHQTMLNVLYKKDKIFNVFRNYDDGKISGRITAAREKLKYDDKNSDDYVPPKRYDELTPWQQISKWADDTYDNLLDKYLKFHGDRLYFSKNAENIVGAINSAKIKPTDGIKGVLDKSADIKKSLLYKSPTATKHFEWFEKTLNEMAGTMKRAFAGALQNGRQMRAIVGEIIMKAVREGKIDEAKTTMEVLSVIKYGATTSKTMDAMAKSDITLFSDGKLSWNKNQGVQFVSNALDKSIKAAFMGIGYGITIIGNEIRLSGSKFNGQRGRIASAQNAWATQNTTDRANYERYVNTEITNANTEITNQRNIQVNINQTRTNPITDANYGTLKSGNDRIQQQLANTANDPAFQTANTNVQRFDELNNHTLPQLHNDITTLQTEKNSLEQALRNPATYNGMPPAARNARQVEIWTQIQEITQQLNDATANLNNYTNELNAITTSPNWATQQNMVTQYETDKRNADSQAQELQQWHDASERIQELNQHKTKLNNELAQWDQKHQDKYRELMAYWDMLETGRDSHMGQMYNWLPRSKKSAQGAFNSQRCTIINDYLSGYSYAA